MELYIRVNNGEIIEHPLTKDNLIQAFPNIDFNNLPNWLMKFERVAPPTVGPYENNQRSQYEIINSVVKDVWYTDPMTPEEILEKQNMVKNDWEIYGFPSWTFDEALCDFLPPVPCPGDENLYTWNEETLSWEQTEY